MNKKDLGPKILDLLLLFLVFLFFQYITMIILNLILLPFQLSQEKINLIYRLLIPPISFSLILYFGFKRSKLNSKGLFINIALSPLKIIALFILGIALNIILSELNNILQSFYPLSERFVKEINNYLFNSSLSTTILYSISTAITVVLEEILFRGIILKTLLKRYSVSVAIFSTSLFALLFSFNLQSIVSLFTLHLLLGWLYTRTSSLLNPILGRVFYQLCTIIALYLLPYKIKGYNSKVSSVATFQPLWFNLLGVVLLVLGVLLLHIEFKKAEN
jgi:hypothetical protein